MANRASARQASKPKISWNAKAEKRIMVAEWFGEVREPHSVRYAKNLSSIKEELAAKVKAVKKRGKQPSQEEDLDALEDALEEQSEAHVCSQLPTQLQENQKPVYGAGIVEYRQVRPAKAGDSYRPQPSNKG